MNPLARLKQFRKAQRLYNELIQGDTRLLVEYFPFVEVAFTPKVVAPPPTPPAPPKKSIPTPRISFRAGSEEDDLRDALDIGFDTLKFDGVDPHDKEGS